MQLYLAVQYAISGFVKVFVCLFYAGISPDRCRKAQAPPAVHIIRFHDLIQGVPSRFNVAYTAPWHPFKMTGHNSSACR